MWKVLVVLSIASAASASFFDNPSVEPFYGGYTMIYTWPAIPGNSINCSVATFAKVEESEELQISCECGRESADLALILQDLPNIKYVQLVDVVQTADDLRNALADKCKCTPNKPRDIIYKVDDDHFLEYETVGDERVYLFGKEVPTQEQVTGLLEKIADLELPEGSLICHEYTEPEE
ncbi:uncharacterized protein [Battus philenor]|uniref:uncharacterized protein n=1 Tax=Battus philenor TaxID=42288 RepID=UPI0035D04D47